VGAVDEARDGGDALVDSDVDAVAGALGALLARGAVAARARCLLLRAHTRRAPMTPLRIVAIGAIFFCTTIAWLILGGTVVERTGSSSGALREEVEGLWGREQRVAPVDVVVERSVERTVQKQVVADGRVITTVERERTREALAAERTAADVDVKLDLEHRKKGLLWWPTYDVAFHARYRFALPAALVVSDGTSTDALALTIPMPASGAVYDGFHVVVDGVERTPMPGDHNAFVLALPRAPSQSEVVVDVRWKSRGLGTWTYVLRGHGTAQVKNLALHVTTNVADVDFPTGTLSPTQRQLVDGGARLSWVFDSLVTGADVGVRLPDRLNPGPVAARIAFFAPVGLLFFFTVMVIVGVINGRSLHPMNYFFLAAAFFAFHLLFAYLVDVVELGVAFAIASVTSLFLVTSYLRIVQGNKVAFLQAGLAQLVFLVGFSLAFFREGQAGLSVTLGSVVTLFVLMQLTARVRWAEVFGGADASSSSGLPVGVPSLTPSSARASAAETAPAGAPAGVAAGPSASSSSG
jgi:inner membrane protein involved in colicin E2 resistance